MEPAKGLLFEKVFQPAKRLVVKKVFEPAKGLVVEKVFQPAKGLVEKVFRPAKGLQLQQAKGLVVEKFFQPAEGLVIEKVFQPAKGLVFKKVFHQLKLQPAKGHLKSSHIADKRKNFHMALYLLSSSSNESVIENGRNVWQMALTVQNVLQRFSLATRKGIHEMLVIDRR